MRWAWWNLSSSTRRTKRNPRGVFIPSLSPGSFVVRFGEAGLRRIAVRFDSAKPAALFVIRRSIRDSGLAEYAALIYLNL
jgi:hypothetical protein